MSSPRGGTRGEDEKKKCNNGKEGRLGVVVGARNAMSTWMAASLYGLVIF